MGVWRSEQGSSAYKEVLRATRRVSDPVAAIRMLEMECGDSFQIDHRLGEGAMAS